VEEAVALAAQPRVEEKPLLFFRDQRNSRALSSQ
jgi:hypothetical protein